MRPFEHFGPNGKAEKGGDGATDPQDDFVEWRAKHLRTMRVVMDWLNAADEPPGVGGRRTVALHEKAFGVLNAWAECGSLHHGGEKCWLMKPKNGCAGCLPLQVTEGLGDGIDVVNGQSAEVRFLHGEQFFFHLVKTKVHPSVGEMAAVMKGSSRGNMMFEARDKLSGIALDSRVVIEAQPKFGMVESATPG
jgi:hypothetical protein